MVLVSTLSLSVCAFGVTYVSCNFSFHSSTSDLPLSFTSQSTQHMAEFRVTRTPLKGHITQFNETTMNTMMPHDRYRNDTFTFTNDATSMERKSRLKKIGKVVYKKMQRTESLYLTTFLSSTFPLTITRQLSPTNYNQHYAHKNTKFLRPTSFLKHNAGSPET